MNNKNRNKSIKLILPMIRGKVVEEGIRYYYSSNKITIKEAQLYTNDYYYLRTKKFPKNIVLEYAQPLDSLILNGIRSFKFMGINKIYDDEVFKIEDVRKNRIVYPDFKIPQINLDGRIFTDSYLELKIISEKKFRSVSLKHQNQCSNYVKNNKNQVILLYLVYKKLSLRLKKLSKYEVFPKIFVISPTY